MTYAYQCTSCDHEFELNIAISKRDQVLKNPCPKCKTKGLIERLFENPSISFDTIDPIRRAGSNWNDVLKKISDGAGKRRSTIEHY
jgi:putative FmdB family regulatory protein